MGGKEVFGVKWIKFINGLFFVCMVVVITAMFFSEEIYEHRIQAISFIIGCAMILWGIAFRVKQDFVYPVKFFKKNCYKENGQKRRNNRNYHRHCRRVIFNLGLILLGQFCNKTF
jgi:cytochrome c biogenesis protein CcdA